jgi:hypothetical protein
MLSASFDWRQGGEFVSYTYRYGESDWKSQRQIDQLIPGGSMTAEVSLQHSLRVTLTKTSYHKLENIQGLEGIPRRLVDFA